MSSVRTSTFAMAALLAVAVLAHSTAFTDDTGKKAGSAKYKVTFKTEPEPPKGAQENTFRVTVSDPKGQPVRDADVGVTLVMPAMPEMNMPEMKSSANLKWTGTEYTGKASIAMAGPWKVTVKVTRNGKVVALHKTDIEAK